MLDGDCSERPSANCEIAHLREEVSALVDCLAEKGVLRPQQLLAQIHKRKFAAILQRHPCSREADIADLVTLGGVLMPVRHHAGYEAILRLRAASSAMMMAVPLDQLRASTRSRLYVCGGDCHGRHLQTVECLDPGANSWETLPPMLTGRSWASATAMDGKIYVCGGSDGRQVLTAAERFHPCGPCDGYWEEISPMLYRREGAAATSTPGGCIYILGGGTGTEVLNTVECYRPQSNEWILLTAMSSKRLGNAAGTIDGQVYVCGGNDHMTSLSTAERYNPRTGFWELLPEMRQRRERFAASVIDGYLYVCGGGDHPQVLSAVERFNPVTDVWEGLPPMPHRRHGVAASAVAGRLLVCGGSYGRQDLRIAESFDPVSGTWVQLPLMMCPRNSAAAVALRT